MANQNFDPNARYNSGANAAGTERISSPQPSTGRTGLGTDSVTSNSDVFAGFNCAGNYKKNAGPNAAGAPRSINNT